MSRSGPTLRDLMSQPVPGVNPREVRQLLAHVIGRSDSWVVAFDETLISASQKARFSSLIERAAAGEPLPYLVGYAPFLGRQFEVSPSVLIPRIETEAIVKIALSFAQSIDRSLTLADIGTGSGCIAISLALDGRPRDRVIGADVSAEALAIAGRNRERLQADNQSLTLIRSDLLSEIQEPIDVMVANLPYITSEEMSTLDRSVSDYEPHLALHGGEDGLRLIDSLLTQINERPLKPLLILLEIGWMQGKNATELAQHHFPDRSVTCIQDEAGHDRIIEIRAV